MNEVQISVQMEAVVIAVNGIACIIGPMVHEALFPVPKAHNGVSKTTIPLLKLPIQLQ